MYCPRFTTSGILAGSRKDVTVQAKSHRGIPLWGHIELAEQTWNRGALTTTVIIEIIAEQRNKSNRITTITTTGIADSLARSQSDC